MERMDHDYALSILGLATEAGRDAIEASYLHRRDVLERRFETAINDTERRKIAAELEDLEQARHALDDLSNKPIPLAGETISLKPGLTLADRYVVRDRIGAGPRAAVFRALDLKRGQDVALKVIAPHILLIPGAFKRLSKAIKRVSILAHPNVCRTLGLVRASGHTAIVMELIEAKNLAAVVAARESRHLIGKGLAVSEIVATLRALADALTYSRVIGPHRNLTPTNVFIGRAGDVKVTDYAIDRIAPLLAGRGGGASANDAFRAPETRISGDSLAIPGATARADQYSMAAIAYFMATGETPGAVRRDLGVLRPDLPKAMVRGIERALSMAPEARFPDTAAFINDISLLSRKGRSLAAWLGGVAAVIAIAIGSFVAIGPRPFIATPVWPLVQWLPGAAELERSRVEALGSAARVERMRADLRRKHAQLKSRISASARDVAAFEGFALPQTEADPRLQFAMLQALSDLVTPNVFNSPGVINAENLLEIARTHVAHHRYAEALTILQAAETVLHRKISDLGQAERLVEAEFGTPIGSSLDESEAAVKAREQRLRATWVRAIALRRAFAEEVDRATVRLPGGTFVMGDQTGVGARSEQPLREVHVQSFKLGRFEVTRGEYEKCVAAGACGALPSTEDESPNLPAANVSWNDASSYVEWLNRATGEAYRLPSEAEWEYAARAGTLTPYPWGETIVTDLANCRGCSGAGGQSGPTPVGSYAANAFGIYDMIGNVWEWTADCWYRDYTSAGTDAAPRQGKGACEYHVIRGGSWDNDPWLSRVSYRAFGSSEVRQDLHGFRIAKSVD